MEQFEKLLEAYAEAIRETQDAADADGHVRMRAKGKEGAAKAALWAYVANNLPKPGEGF